MGELSRMIGELGENITLSNVLQKIGWRGMPNKDIPCHLHKQHNKGPKGKHGLDFFAAHVDPLSSETLSAIAASVKYNEASPTNTEFIEYSTAVTAASECLEFTSGYSETIRVNRTTKAVRSCVLFWLNHKSDDERNLLNKITDISSEMSPRFDTIYLVDNYRLSFLYKAVEFSEKLFPNSSCKFVYPATGMNDRIDGKRELAGKILPVEFINSPVLPFQVIDEAKHKILVLCLNEKFDDNSLRRMMGLAEGMTNGWCNKIILAFPDYQHSRHESTKHEVFMGFGSDFADMVEVMSYNNSFKNLERNTNQDFYESLNQEEAKNNVKTMLPFGDRLRQLLVQSYIYKQDLQILLNKRGVFVDKQSGKNDLIPLISKMLLSPSEFDFLRRKQVQKESSEKVSSQPLIVSENFSNADILPILKSSLGEGIVSKIILKNHENCQLASSPTIELDDSGDIRISYQILRDNLSKDWVSASAVFDAQVVIKSAQSRAGVYQCRVDAISTSIETKNISKHIIYQFIRELKERGLVSTVSQPGKLMASSLVSRSNFLFKFVADKNKLSSLILFKELLNVESRIANNSKETLPEDVESLKDKVSTSVFSGHTLQEISYISNPKYRKFFDNYLKVCIFQVNLSTFKGSTQIEFGFPDLKNKSENKSEFEFKIIDITPSDNRTLSTREYHEIELALREEFHNMKDRAYQTAEKTHRQTSLLL